MSGNNNSGRKKLKTPSFEIRFQMPGHYKEKLQKKADKLGVSYNHYAKWLIQQDLEK